MDTLSYSGSVCEVCVFKEREKKKERERKSSRGRDVKVVHILSPSLNSQFMGHGRRCLRTVKVSLSRSFCLSLCVCHLYSSISLTWLTVFPLSPYLLPLKRPISPFLLAVNEVNPEQLSIAIYHQLYLPLYLNCLLTNQIYAARIIDFFYVITILWGSQLCCCVGL